MALIPSANYPAQIDTGDPDYPHGKARNAGSYQDGTGTPLEAGWINDIWGFLQALLAKAGITPSGNADKVGASQYLDALLALATKTQTITTIGEVTLSIAATTTIVRVNHTVANSRLMLKGISGGWDGRRLRIYNVSAVDSAIELWRDTPSIAAADRILYNYEDLIGSGLAGLILYEDMGIDLWYDGASSRWRPLVHMTGGFA